MSSFLPKQNLVGYWPLDGYALDLSGQGNNGTVIGAMPVPSLNTAIPASLAYKFNGSSDYINVGNFQMPSRYTVMMWLWLDALGAGEPIAKDDVTTRCIGWNINSTYMQCYGWNAGGNIVRVDTPDISIKTWNHVSVTWNASGNCIIYWNGKYVNVGGRQQNQSTGGNAKTASLQMDFGRREYPSSYDYLNGKLQEVAIFNKVLSAQEIQAIYNQSKRKYTSK